MRDQLEALRDRIIDSVDLADMSNSQLIAVADGLTEMINLACAIVDRTAPVGVVEVASLAVIDQRLRAFLKSEQKAPRKVTQKKAKIKKASKKR
jgi:hypothetical protein